MDGELIFDDTLFKSIEASFKGHDKKVRRPKEEEVSVERRGLGYKPSEADQKGNELRARVKQNRALASIIVPNQASKRRQSELNEEKASLEGSKRQKRDWKDGGKEEEASKGSLVSRESSQTFSILLPKLQMASQSKKKGKKKKKKQKKKQPDVEESL